MYDYSAKGKVHRQLSVGKFFLFSPGGFLVIYMFRFFNIVESSGLPLLLSPVPAGILRGLSIVFYAETDPWLASTLINEYPTVYGVRLTALIACGTVFAALLLFGHYDDRGTVSAIDN